MAAFSIILASH